MRVRVAISILSKRLSEESLMTMILGRRKERRNNVDCGGESSRGDSPLSVNEKVLHICQMQKSSALIRSSYLARPAQRIDNRLLVIK